MTTPAPAAFQCAVSDGLPYKGTEVLIVALFFLFIVVCFCVTFLAVAAKQLWPEKYLDPAVRTRVQAIQASFPDLKKNSGDDSETTPLAEADKVENAGMQYTKVVSQEAYIAGRSVDEDLVYVLSNNSAFSTVSSYCSATVRGYAMLSTTLNCAAIILAFLWIHNVMINRAAADTAGQVSLFGYIMVILTGSVMCPPSRDAVDRTANIALWSNLPLRIFNGKMSNPLLHLHEIGIVGFVALPCFAHLYTAWTQGPTMPNYHATVYGVCAQLGGAVLFGLSNFLKGKGLTPLQSAQYAITAEVICVFASFLAYLQYEYFATASCAGSVTYFNSLIMGTAVTPFAFVMKHYYCAPSTFGTKPSVLLMNGSQQVGASGPVPVTAFDSNVPSNEFNPSVPMMDPAKFAPQ